MKSLGIEQNREIRANFIFQHLKELEKKLSQIFKQLKSFL